jgi:curved DNA-binding protein CbpA
VNFYTTLGIKKTAGVQEIKRAYAAKLKLHRPDDDPVQFQAINTAYQFALDNAKRRESFAAMNPESRQSNLVTAADDGQNEQYDYEDDDFFSGEEPEFDQDNHDHDRYRIAMMSDALKAPSAFAPAPESQTESGPMDRNEFDIDEFMSEFMQAATVKNPNMATWLQNHPALFSIELKDWLCEPILDHLEMQPTLRPQVLKDIFHFFDLDTLNQKSAWIGP